MTNALILQQRHEKMEEDYGIKSMEESMLKSDSIGEWVVPKVKLLSHQQKSTSRFRMIVCGDSGTKKKKKNILIVTQDLSYIYIKRYW